MYKLYHHTLSPLSRMVRVLLAEIGVKYVLYEEKFWDLDQKFLRLNPMGTIPVLITPEGTVLNHIQLILEYIYANYNQDIIFPKENDVLETKKIAIWFYEKLYFDCTKYIVKERFLSIVHNALNPDANVLSMARYNIAMHYDYLNFLLENNTWLAGERFSIADISAATQLSVLDFMGEIQWSKVPLIKNWYCIIKSRPAFRSLLKERLPNVNTPKHYSLLDY